MKINFIWISIIVCSLVFPHRKPHSEIQKINNKRELSEWFESGVWKSGWKKIPDESINQQELRSQFLRNGKRWEKAFNFLNTTNLDSISSGRYELDGSNLYAIVDEYSLKEEINTRFEAHRNYADIQYVINGKERIGIAELKKTKVVLPYDSIKDIVFLTIPQSDYKIASPERFFVFFPNDAHRPGIKVVNNIKVRKIVVKVRIN